MYELLVELGGEALALLAYAAGALGLSLLGLAAEYNGLQLFLGGDHLTALWLAFMGVVALAFAVTLARERLVPRAAARR